MILKSITSLPVFRQFAVGMQVNKCFSSPHVLKIGLSFYVIDKSGENVYLYLNVFGDIYTSDGHEGVALQLYCQRTYILGTWSKNNCLCDNTLGDVEQTLIEMQICYYLQNYLCVQSSFCAMRNLLAGKLQARSLVIALINEMVLYK